MDPAKQIFTVAEAGTILGLSRHAVTQLFEDEPGVLVMDRPEGADKRRYRTLRIPRAVLTRVLGRLSNKGTITVKYCRTPKPWKGKR